MLEGFLFSSKGSFHKLAGDNHCPDVVNCKKMGGCQFQTVVMFSAFFNLNQSLHTKASMNEIVELKHFYL